MPRGRKEVRVELTRADLVNAAGYVPGVLNKRTAASATAVRFEMKWNDANAEPKEDSVLAVVTFVFDKKAEVE